MRQRQVSQLLIGIALIALCIGCNTKEPTYSVKGKVVYKDDGSPAGSGVAVVFESTKKPYTRASGEIQPDGSFILTTDRPDNGAMQGEHRISILPMAMNGSGDNLTPQMSQKIDPKYFEFRTSGLTADIKPNDTNDIVVKVERPK